MRQDSKTYKESSSFGGKKRKKTSNFHKFHLINSSSTTRISIYQSSRELDSWFVYLQNSSKSRKFLTTEIVELFCSFICSLFEEWDPSLLNFLTMNVCQMWRQRGWFSCQIMPYFVIFCWWCIIPPRCHVSLIACMACKYWLIY